VRKRKELEDKMTVAIGKWSKSVDHGPRTWFGGIGKWYTRDTKKISPFGKI